VASGFPASATCIRRPVESVTKAWVTPGSSGISVGASGVSVTTPFSYSRSGQFTTSDRRREPRVRHEPPYDAAMASRSGETDNCR
jgi:hypothetical protein